MPAQTYTYVAQRFFPRSADASPLLLFVAPASEVRSWAGVPRKAFDYQHGFQRSLQPNRVAEVAGFFSYDVRNISPTAVVVGLIQGVTYEQISSAHDGARIQQFKVMIDVPDLEDQSIEDVAKLARDRIRERLDSTLAAQIEGDIDAALNRAIDLEMSESVDESFGIVAETSSEGVVETQSHSYLGDFYARVLGFLGGRTAWPEDENSLREVLYSFLKPGILVDGQHRVFGAAIADEDMHIAVCALPDASWAESVYQFVVINQKAKPIKPAFLSAIVATSLNSEEIDGVYRRLRQSNVDVDRAAVMEKVNVSPDSPFRSMIDFEVANSDGFLKFPGMATLVRSFLSIANRYPVLLPEGDWSKVEGDWLDHFFAFWRGTRKYFESSDTRLWQRPSEANPNNLLKIVALQEIQELVLSSWADSRSIKIDAIEDTERKALEWWTDFPSTFFSDEWKIKGLQTSAGRQILSSAIRETRRNLGRKHWGHRKLGLFQGQ